MKIDIVTNHFCPDNCPYFNWRTETLVTDELNNVKEITHYCSNEDICLYAYKLGLNRINEIESEVTE